MRTVHWRTIVVVSLALGLARPAAAGEILIDDFNSAVNQVFNDDTGNPPLNVSQQAVGSTTVLDTGLPDVLGGSRELTVTATVVFDPNPPDRVTAGVSPAPLGFFNYASTNGADGSFRLLYDRDGNGLNANLSKAIGIRMNFLADLAAPPYDVTLTLMDDGSSVAVTRTILCPALACPDPEVIVSFRFNEFPGINPARLQSIQLDVNPKQAADLILDRIEAYGTISPVPAVAPRGIAWLTAMLVLVGLWASRRPLARRRL
jgi:hypothetical protein